MARKRMPIYQIKVRLDNTHLPVWRRIQVPGKVTLEELHQILQSVMGWWDSHLHAFTILENPLVIQPTMILMNWAPKMNPVFASTA